MGSFHEAIVHGNYEEETASRQQTAAPEPAAYHLHITSTSTPTLKHCLEFHFLLTTMIKGLIGGDKFITNMSVHALKI